MRRAVMVTGFLIAAGCFPRVGQVHRDRGFVRVAELPDGRIQKKFPREVGAVGLMPGMGIAVWHGVSPNGQREVRPLFRALAPAGWIPVTGLMNSVLLLTPTLFHFTSGACGEITQFTLVGSCKTVGYAVVTETEAAPSHSSEPGT